MTKAMTFSLLAVDTFEYIMGIKGVDWNYSKVFDDVPDGARTVFDERFGDAVICYLMRHEKQISEFTKISSFSTLDEIADFGLRAIPILWKNDCFLMDIIRVFALFSYIALSCLKSGKSDLITVVVDYLSHYYTYYLAQPLTIVGGYHTLFRFSEQYSEFYSNDLEKIDSVGNKGEHTITTATESEILPSNSFEKNSLKQNNIESREVLSIDSQIESDPAAVLKRTLQQEFLATKIAFYKDIYSTSK